MSIEDPRLSSIDNLSAADDFDTAVEQHLGLSGDTVDGIEVAQAESPDAGRTDRLPAQTPPVQTASATIPAEVTPNAQNVVTLPAGIDVDNLEFQVDGETWFSSSQTAPKLWLSRRRQHPDLRDRRYRTAPGRALCRSRGLEHQRRGGSGWFLLRPERYAKQQPRFR